MLRERMRMAGSGGGSTDSGADLDLRSLYLDLLERALTHTLYHPPDTRELPENVKEAFAEEFIRLGVAQEFLRLGEPQDSRDTERRAEGKDWPVYAQTMVGQKRLRNVRDCVEGALADGIGGDLIEAGCWRGGVAILMRGILRAHGVDDRAVWAADSFAGLPEPDEGRYPADTGDQGHALEELAVDIEEVRNNFRRYDLFDDQVKLLPGWFNETLPTLRDRRWAVVRLDGDLYESTMDGLVNLYPRLEIGGYLIVDDYGFDNCRAAVEDYRQEHGITDEVQRVDWTGAFWRRTA